MDRPRPKVQVLVGTWGAHAPPGDARDDRSMTFLISEREGVKRFKGDSFSMSYEKIDVCLEYTWIYTYIIVFKTYLFDIELRIACNYNELHGYTYIYYI